jgi:hypothetical protein
MPGCWMADTGVIPHPRLPRLTGRCPLAAPNRMSRVATMNFASLQVLSPRPLYICLRMPALRANLSEAFNLPKCCLLGICYLPPYGGRCQSARLSNSFHNASQPDRGRGGSLRQHCPFLMSILPIRFPKPCPQLQPRSSFRGSMLRIYLVHGGLKNSRSIASSPLVLH